jgi:hypothetical protein
MRDFSRPELDTGASRKKRAAEAEHRLNLAEDQFDGPIRLRIR